MARGWESKSVEQQQEARQEQTTPGRVLSAEEIARRRKKQTLTLARQQVLQQLQVASNPRHREMLEKALSHLDGQLAAL